MARSIAVGALACALLASVVTTSPAAAEPAGPAAAPVTRDAAGIGFFVGTWTGTGTLYGTPFQPGDVPVRMVVHAAMAGPNALAETVELTPVAGGDTLRALWIWVYDPAARTYRAQWWDNTGGTSQETSDGWHDGKLVFTGTTNHHGSTAPLRDSFDRLGPAEYVHTGELDFGTGWVRIEQETAHR